MGNRRWSCLLLVAAAVIATFSAPFTCRYHGVLIGLHPYPSQPRLRLLLDDEFWCSPEYIPGLGADTPGTHEHSVMNTLIITSTMALAAPMQVIVVRPSLAVVFSLEHEPIPAAVSIPPLESPPRL